MKTLKTFFKNTFFTKIIVLLCLTTLACSKDDAPLEPIEIVKSIEKELTSFSFLSADNEALNTDVVSNINATSKTITANLPSDTHLIALAPKIVISAKASISPTDAQDFTSPVTYTVTAEDGSTNSYSVTVTSNSSAKQITSFVFLATNNPITANVVTTINEEDKTIIVTMPVGTNITGLQPEIQLSELATVDPVTAQDFTAPLEYTVAAEDGSEVIYIVTVTTLLSQRQILQTILDANPGNTLGWDINATANLEDLNGVKLNTEGEIIELRIIDKTISTLPSEIGQLIKLTELGLNGNQLTSLPPEIKQLTNLIDLNLRANEFTSLPPEIGQLINLTDLNLRDNQLTSLPPEIRGLSNLTNLDLTSNQFTSFPSEIVQLTNLIELTLIFNQLTSIPPEIGQLTNLEVLVLLNNQLTSIPAEIGQLTNLATFQIDKNQLTSLPPEIGQLTNLTRFEVNGNPLTFLPVEIGQLTNLEWLLLQNNQLTALPPELGFLIKLELLDIRGNNLTTIPQAICNLKEIPLINTLLIFMDTNVTCTTTSQKDALISIYSANPDNSLEWGVGNFPGVGFNADGNPIAITVNNKNLTRIPDTIDQLDELGNLGVNGNNLESLPATLANINALTVIAAGNNNLSSVPSEFGQLTNLVLLSIPENPIASIPQEVCDLQTSNGGILTLLTDPGEGCN